MSDQPEFFAFRDHGSERQRQLREEHSNAPRPDIPGPFTSAFRRPEKSHQNFPPPESESFRIAENITADPHDPEDISEISESTYIKLTSTAEPLPPFRRDSFSSIVSQDSREQFTQALDTLCDTLKQPFRSNRSETPKATTGTHIVLTDSSVFNKMDYDLSPNGPPQGIEDPTQQFAVSEASPIPAHSGGESSNSNQGSIDSTGFEKIETPSDEVLEAYSQNFANQMQQSLFGALPDDPTGDEFARECGFEVLDPKMFGKSSSSKQQPKNERPVDVHSLHEETPEPVVHLLHRTPGEIDDPRSAMSAPRHDDVLEKSYGDLIDIPPNKVDDVAEKADKIKDAAQDLLGDFHQSPSKPAEPAQAAFDDLLGDFDTPAPVHAEPTPHAGFEDVHEPDHQPLHKTADILPGAFHKEEPKEEHKHEPVPSHPSNASPHHELTATEIIGNAKEDSKKPENDDIIAEHVDTMHDDVDAIMNRMRDNDEWATEDHPTSPSADSGRDVVGKLLGEEDDSPQFGRQTPPEEGTYEREGPLTIPELPETLPEDNWDRPPSDHQHHGFETEPRPPTPPKDISDEDVKPSVMNLGPAPHHYHGSGSQHSILKPAPWFDFKTVDPRILDLIYWRDPKKSAIALSLTFVVLFVLAKYSLLTVISYTSGLVLIGTFGFRIFKCVEAQIKKTDQQNPFQPLLEQDITIPQEKVHQQVDVLVEHGQLLANQTRRLFLVESFCDSFKFGLLLWTLTYVSVWFSGVGLIILAVLGVFSIPKFYEVYQEPIDAHLGLIKGHLDNVCNILEEKLPFLKRAPAATEPEKKDQ